MRGAGRIIIRVALVALLLAGSGAVALAVRGLEGGTPRLSAFGGGPDNVGRWRDTLGDDGNFEVESSISSPSMLDHILDPERAVWTILGAERRYTPDEEAALERFLNRGGSLLVADTSGNANRFLSPFEVRVSPARLLDLGAAENLSLVPAEAQVEGQRFHILLRSPASLLVDEEFSGTVLSRSSDRSYVDLDSNYRVDENDVPGPFDLVAVWETPAKGRLLVISDVGIFLNEGFDLPGFQHGEFHRALASLLLPSGGRFIVDEGSHRQPASVEALARANRASLQVASTVAAKAGLVALLAILALLPLGAALQSPWRKHQPDLTPRSLRPSHGRIAAAVRDSALRALSAETGLRVDHLSHLPPDELAALSATDVFRKALANPESLTPRELSQLLVTIKQIEG